ncbi:hypothetical protein CYMTET_28528 [Cymbomonas tetramitiformis]|uniref:Uncharacterized protein n=1 Tax=Cymbomonas tetramitiformis TaxID=36881 RepID=A0AAE0FP69_9CHLO|nr:hypothetical protein CYMTET_28528 [Cymbomonas tetramitiformis]
MDACMPDMDGVATTHCIRSMEAKGQTFHPFRRQIPILIHTGYGISVQSEKTHFPATGDQVQWTERWDHCAQEPLRFHQKDHKSPRELEPSKSTQSSPSMRSIGELGPKSVSSAKGKDRVSHSQAIEHYPSTADLGQERSAKAEPPSYSPTPSRPLDHSRAPSLEFIRASALCAGPASEHSATLTPTINTPPVVRLHATTAMGRAVMNVLHMTMDSLYQAIKTHCMEEVYCHAGLEDVYDLKAALELFSALTRDSCKGRCGVGMERMFTELVTEVSRVLTLRSRIAQSIDNRKLQATVSAFTGGGIQMPEGFSNLGELLHLVRECLT